MLLFAVFLLYVCLSYVYPGEVFPALAPYRLTYWVGIAGLLGSVVSLAFKRSQPLATIQLWFLLALTATLILSRMLAERWFGAAIPALNAFGPSLVMFLLALCAVDSLRKLRVAAALVGMLSLFLAFQGIAAYHFGYHTDMFLFDPYTRAEYVPTAEPSDETATQAPAPRPDSDEAADADSDIDPESTQVRIRGLGLMHDPNDLALGLVMAMPLIWAAWRARALARNLFFVIVPTGALIYGLYLTRSRGGALAFAVTLCVALSRRIGRMTAVLLFVGFVAGGLVTDLASGRELSFRDESVSGRFDAWSEGLQMFKGQPLLGVGYGQFLEHHDLTAHNSLVLCFAETGLIGYFFWFGLLFLTFAQLRALARLPGDEPIDQSLRHWATALGRSSVGFMIAAMFLSRSFIGMLYLLLGMAVALTLIARAAKRPVWSPSVPQLGSLVLVSEVASIVLIYVAVRLHLV
jgi:putative inorganic carbon (HCO3(-)) transporter